MIDSVGQYLHNFNSEISRGVNNINSFGVLAKEMILEIFKSVSRQDQARLALVDKRFNQLANHTSLDLFEYKRENKRIAIGNVCFWVLKKDLLNNATEPYFSYTTRDGIKVPDSNMDVDKDFFDSLLKSIDNGLSSIVELLKNSGWSPSLNGKVLEDALNAKLAELDTR